MQFQKEAELNICDYSNISNQKHQQLIQTVNGSKVSEQKHSCIIGSSQVTLEWCLSLWEPQSVVGKL